MLHRRSRTILATLAAAVLAACSSGTGPSGQLDPAATRQTAAQLQQSFSAPAVQSFEGASSAIGSAIGGGIAVQAFTSPAAAADAPRLTAFGRRQLAIATAGTTAEVAIPTAALGRTFEWSTTQNRYVVASTPPSDLGAVPSNGVRFLLYQWDAAADRPVTPLVRVGHADLTETTGSSGRTWRLVVVANGTTFLDYSANYQFSQAQQTAAVTAQGFVTNGTDRANFTLINQIAQTNNGSVTLDYVVNVPSRGITLDYLVQLRNLNVPTGDEQVVIDLILAGGGNQVRLAGTLAAAGATDVSGSSSLEGAVGTLTITANGGTFATITFAAGADPVFRNAQGQPLTADERDALEDVFDLIEDGFDFIEDLLDPIDDLFV